MKTNTKSTKLVILLTNTDKIISINDRAILVINNKETITNVRNNHVLIYQLL